MPRSRGGPRAGTPGQSYSNRTDLNTNRTLPVKAAPGQVYGQAAAQEAAQRAVPMGPPGAASGPQGAPQGLQGASPIPPGAFGDIHRPTERPMEPVTAGAALGPGPGPEALGPGANPGNNVSDLLQKAAGATGSNLLMQMAQNARSVGQ